MTNLIDEIENLREVEQEMWRKPWISAVASIDRPQEQIGTPCILSDDGNEILADVWGGSTSGSNCNGIVAFRNLAPAMLEVLSMVQAGDAKKIQDFGMRLHAQCAQVFPDDWALLNRLQHMAIIMEKEER